MDRQSKCHTDYGVYTGRCIAAPDLKIFVFVQWNWSIRRNNWMFLLLRNEKSNATRKTFQFKQSKVLGGADRRYTRAWLPCAVDTGNGNRLQSIYNSILIRFYSWPHFCSFESTLSASTTSSDETFAKHKWNKQHKLGLCKMDSYIEKENCVSQDGADGHDNTGIEHTQPVHPTSIRSNRDEFMCFLCGFEYTRAAIVWSFSKRPNIAQRIGSRRVYGFRVWTFSQFTKSLFERIFYYYYSMLYHLE